MIDCPDILLGDAEIVAISERRGAMANQIKKGK
jgi:hypothetical protein